MKLKDLQNGCITGGMHVSFGAMTCELLSWWQQLLNFRSQMLFGVTAKMCHFLPVHQQKMLGPSQFSNFEQLLVSDC